MSKSYATDDWRATKAEETPVNYGLFAAPSPTPDEASESLNEEITETGTAEVVDCTCDDALTDSDLPHNSGTTTTSQPSEEEENQAIDLNDLPSDPNALPKFPLWGLPKIMQDVATQGAEVYRVPPEFFAMSMLQTVGASARKGVYSIGTYRNYPQIWFMEVAASGIGKSEPMSVALKPLQEIDRRSYDNWNRELEEWSLKCSENQRKPSKNREEQPNKPIYKQTIIGDVTPEALFQTLQHNHKGLLLFYDELRGWFENMGRYSKSGEIQNYLSLFDNRTVSINRKTEDPALISDPFLSIMGSVQPTVLSRWLQTPSVVDNGFVPRFLFVFPDNLRKAEPSGKMMSEELLGQYEGFILRICEYCNQDYWGTQIPISDDAKRLLLSFECELVRLQNNTEVDALKALYSKMLIHVNRLAIAVAVAKHYAYESGFEITADTMRYCIELGRYFIATGEKVHRFVYESQAKPVISNRDLIRLVDERYGIKNQTMLAKSLGVSQQTISDKLKK